MKRVTNKDVARRAGVSTAVVSYVLNDGPRPTSANVKQRVWEAVQELDYHPSAIAKGLRSQKSHMVALIVCDYEPHIVFTSPYNAGLLTGLVEELKGAEHFLTVYPVGLHEDLTALRRFLRGGRLDGVVVRLAQDPPANNDVLEIVRDSGIPSICIERVAPHFDLPSVTIDEQTGGYEATRYLIERGYRRIAHIHGDLRYLSARIRMQRYRQALLDAGLPVDEALICGGTWSAADGAAAMKTLLSLPQPPTAVFAANDSLAFGAMQLVQAQCMKIPDDLAIVGFDDIPLAAQTQPPLTTMRIPLVEMGRQAARLILEVIHSEGKPARSILVPTELVRRSSA